MKRFFKTMVGRLATTRARFVGTDNDCIDAWFEAQPEDEEEGQSIDNDELTAPHAEPIGWSSSPSS